MLNFWCLRLGQLQQKIDLGSKKGDFIREVLNLNEQFILANYLNVDCHFLLSTQFLHFYAGCGMTIIL